MTCKVGPQEYKKHFLRLSDNVTYLAEQLDSADVSTYHHRITFKPQAMLPDIDFRGSVDELLDDSSELGAERRRGGAPEQSRRGRGPERPRGRGHTAPPAGPFP